jgi:hypothetical protein
VNLATKAPVHDTSGKLELAERGEAGLLVVRDGADWVTTNDVVHRDDDGDFWFVDSLSGFVLNQSTRQIEDRFYAELDVDVAAAYRVGEDIWVAYVGEAIDRARLVAMHGEHRQPSVIIRLDAIPLTEGFRADKSGLPRSLGDARIRDVVEARG